MYCDTIFESENAEERIIGFLALLGYATKGQLQSLCLGSKAEHECDEAVNRLISSEQLLAFPSHLPREMGDKTIDVFCLAPTSRLLIKKYLPGLDQKFCRFGIPETVNLSRIPHELVVTEAVLWYAARGLILAYMSENALRSEREKKRIKAAGGFRNAQRMLIAEPELAISNLNLGDFQVLVRFEHETNWLYCEAAVRYDVREISDKPRNLVWFTPGVMQARKVLLYAMQDRFEAKIVVIGDITRSDSRNMDAQHADQTANRVLPEGRKRKAFSYTRHREIRDWLHSFPCGLTADALGCLMNAPRNYLTSILRQMESSEILASERGQLLPGFSKGNTYRVYSLRTKELNAVTEESVQRTQHAVFLSRCIMQANEEGLVFENYITSDDVLLFVRRHNNTQFLIVCDNRSRSIVDLAERYYRAIRQEYAQDRHTSVAVIDDNIGIKEDNPLLFRLEMIRKNMPEWDFWYINSVARSRAKGADKLGL